MICKEKCELAKGRGGRGIKLFCRVQFVPYRLTELAKAEGLVFNGKPCCIPAVEASQKLQHSRKESVNERVGNHLISRMTYARTLRHVSELGSL